ncbi:MAG: VanZ family protein [Clostridia bacterium]|nr:VanZ family protein [Clostridia bacterium]
MKQKYKKIVLWTLVALHICLIFSFSLQDAQQSTVVSEKFTDSMKSEEKFHNEVVGEKNDDGSRKYSDAIVDIMAKRRFDILESVLRKVAHFSLFFILGILICALMYQYKIKGITGVLSTVLYSGAVAFIDETIQLFSPGRAGEITDVLIDSSGAACAAILFLIGGLIYEKYKIRRLKVDN